jgi:hypothetical protein
MTSKRILWISDSPGVPTGNGLITRKFVEGMHRSGKYEVAVLGRGYFGWPGECEKYGCTIYPMDIGKPYPDLLKTICGEYRPQIIVSCLDM